jgi:FAD/FMN-containing dehydrogenase
MDANRRAVLLSGMAATAAHGAAATPTDAVPPALAGRIHCYEPARAAAADDFGHIVRERPRCILRPQSPGDVAAAIRWANARGLRFAAQGRRHSVFGRGMARDGIVAEMSELRTIHDMGDDRIVVDAGATWHEVLSATLPRGLSPPVLTEYLELSIGGTLVVGGVGSGSQRHGLQSDNVLSMDVVTGTGHEITCSAESNAELFDAVRAGLGQVAVITRATLRLVPAPRQVRRHLLFYRDLGTMLTDQRLLMADNRFDAVMGAILAKPEGGWLFRLDAARYLMAADAPAEAHDDAVLAGLSDDASKRQASTLASFDYLNRLSQLETLLRGNGQWFLPHPWLMTFIGDRAVEAVVGQTLATLKPADLGPFGQVSLSAIPRKAIASPLLRLPSDELSYAFNLVRIPATDNGGEIGRLIEDNRVVYGRVRDAGGTLYPVSALPMTRDDWQRHFGPEFARLSAAKRRFDPANLLTPGYPIF